MPELEHPLAPGTIIKLADGRVAQVGLYEEGEDRYLASLTTWRDVKPSEVVEVIEDAH